MEGNFELTGFDNKAERDQVSGLLKQMPILYEDEKSSSAPRGFSVEKTSLSKEGEPHAEIYPDEGSLYYAVSFPAAPWRYRLPLTS